MGIVVKGIAGAEAVGQVVKIVGEVQGGGPAPPEEQGQKPPQSGMGWLLPDAQRRIKGQEGHPHVGNDIGIPAEQLQPGKLLKDQVLILPQEHQPQHQRYHPRQAPAGGAVEDAPADAGTPIEDERAVQGGGGVNEGKNCRQQVKHAPPSIAAIQKRMIFCRVDRVMCNMGAPPLHSKILIPTYHKRVRQATGERGSWEKIRPFGG